MILIPKSTHCFHRMREREREGGGGGGEDLWTWKTDPRKLDPSCLNALSNGHD